MSKKMNFAPSKSKSSIQAQDPGGSFYSDKVFNRDDYEKQTKRWQKLFLLLMFLLLSFSVCLRSSNDVLATNEITSFFIPDEDKLNSEFINIDTIEYDNYLDYGKYKYIPPYSFDNKLITTHEYVTPTGEIGYQVIIDDDINIISLGNGPEANARTFIKLKADIIE